MMKKMYESPKLISYRGDQILEILKPALAVYKCEGFIQPNGNGC